MYVLYILLQICTYGSVFVHTQHRGKDNAAHLDGDAEFSSIHLFQATEAPKFYCFNMAAAAITAAITQRGHHTTDLSHKSVPIESHKQQNVGSVPTILASMSMVGGCLCTCVCVR